MKVFEKISQLLNYATNNLELDERDVSYVRNGIIDMLQLNTFEQSDNVSDCNDIDRLLKEFCDVAVSENVFESQYSAYYCDKIMGMLSLSPSKLNERFAEIKAQKGTKCATDWLYRYCIANNYVKKAVLDRNPRYESNGLVITINLAKPEFRSANSAKSGNSVAGGYPSCVICRDNEGFTPRGKCTLRTVDVNVCGKRWFWQYSPYGYFNEHGILVNTEHIPMHVDKQTFYNLIDFVDQVPHYFVGSNAALERIGGSVLAHDHYQGGGEVLPLHKAQLTQKFTYNNCTDVEIGIVDWPGTVVRVSSSNKQHLVEVCDSIRNTWVNYDNEQLGILHGKDGKMFSAVSPTVVKVGNVYQMNIILRNNITSDKYPDGVFHAHPEYHVIKKESIGLIEAQGLFILPGRLVEQLDQLEDAIISGNLPTEMSDFTMVYNEAKALTKSLNKQDVHVAVQTEIASICYRILQNTAVFKKESDFVDFLKLSGLKLK